MNKVRTNKRLIKEDPDEVTKTDGTKLYWDTSDSHPFFFDKGMGMLVMGGSGLKHDDILRDVYDALGQYAPDPSEQDDYFNAFMSEYESTDPNLVTGRIWTEERIISLWGSTDRPTMRNIAYAFGNDYGINVDDYELDMDDKLIPLVTFLEGTKETPQFTHPEIHTMPSAEKRATPQLQGARDAVAQAKAQKLGGTSEAEYNFYRRYGLGDSVQHNEQPLRESPDSIWVPGKCDLSYEDDDAYPFIYDLETKQLFLAGEGNTHEWIENEIEDYLVDVTDWYETDRDKVHEFIDRVLSRETDSSVIGRLWYRHGVISFWKMPKTQSALKETIDALCRDFGQNIWDYEVELDTGLAPLKSLLHKDEPQETHFNLNTIHNLSPKEKWNTPQLKGARDTAARIKAEKLGNTPEAKYNFYRRYGLGDSKQINGQPLTESPDSLMWTNERGKSEEIHYGADDARPFFYDTENDDLYVFPQNITHYGIISWVASEMKKKHPEMSDEDCKRRAKEADNRRSAYGASGRIWTGSKVISFWTTPNVDVLEKIVGKFNEQGIKIEGYTLDFYDFADDTTLGKYIENEKETDYSGMTPEPWFDLDMVHNLPAEEKWNTPQLRGARETGAKLRAKKLGSMPQAKYNFYRRYGIGDSVQHNDQPLIESPDRLYYNNGDKNDVFINFKTQDAYPFIYDKTDGMLYIGLPGAWHSFLIEWIADEIMENHPEMDEDEAMAHSEDILSRTSENSVSGRIWKKHKVISFWSDPSLEEMQEVVSAFKGQGIDILPYKLDIDNTAERPLKDYLNGENLKKSNFDTTIVHNLNPKEKWNSPQIKAARDARYDAIAKKLGDTPEAEYNFYKRYGMGDSVVRKGALLKEDPNIVDFHDGFELRLNAPYVYPFIYDSDEGVFYLGEESKTHNDMYDTVRKTLIDNHPNEDVVDLRYEAFEIIGHRRPISCCYGRIWTQGKVISFWDSPSHKDAIRIFSELEKKFGSLNGYMIDMGDWGMPIETYLSDDKEKKEKPNFDPYKLHLMPAAEKREAPQMKAARDAVAQAKAEKLGKTPEAEYDFYRRYGMGDGKETDNAKQINEIDAQNISLQSFVPQDELNPKFWINGKLNSNVRIKLLQIAHNFMDESKVNWVEPEDVVLTGSIANYNWSKYSDVDVHIILDYNKVWKKREFVEDYFGDKKELWSNTHPNLKIYGFPVEVYVEDLNTPADSSGIYSLLRNEWLKEPVDFNDSLINAEYVKNYAARIETKIDRIIAKIRKEKNARKIEDYSKALQAIFDKLKNLRKEGLRKGGEMGSGNIIWKICKRMGYLDKLWDSVNLAYDRAHSIG